MCSIEGKNAAELTKQLQSSLDEIEAWRDEHLSLDGGFGLAGPSIGRTHRPWLYSMSADYYPGERVHLASPAFDDIENLAIDLARKLYHCKYVDLHTLSAGSATMVAICALTEAGDTIMSLPDPLGHRSMRKDGFGQFIKRNYVDIPVDASNLCIKMDEFEELALRERPRLIMLGSALYIFNEPFREIRAIADKIGALVYVDVSHTLGLIQCSMGVNPLDNGAHIIAGSTYKTVSGPNKGVICTNSPEIRQKIHDTALRMVFNYNAFLIPALAQAFIELYSFGEGYGCQMIKNAKALGHYMQEQGFDVVGSEKGFTDTHLIAVKMSGSDPHKVVEQLGRANILCSTVPLDKDNFYLRPATLVPTRRGMLEKDMELLASLLAEVILNNEPEKAKIRVAQIMNTPESKRVYFSQS
ncbi:MAG: hypothetical protein IJZ91_04980 [Oscillospiraceae bacterium]|nr:hypothetical protein [Oscillospiraceae bacterium]